MTKIKTWTTNHIPSQRGRTLVVTGTGGLGFQTALALANAGGDVIIAGRNPLKGAEAVDCIRQDVPGATVAFEAVDLGSLASIAAFSRRLADNRRSIDVLVNNAGVMTPPRRQVTADGFELQFGTNHLGHFALTAQLLPLLRRGANPRVVSLSSVAARHGSIDFEDLQAVGAYRPMPVYAQSKLACLMFAFELQRRSDAAGWGIASIAAHPGIARTDLLHNAPGRFSAAGLARSVLWFLFQPAAQGALPTLFAATAAEAVDGGYYGPHRLGETRGYPAAAKPPAQSLEAHVAARLWDVSGDLTGVTFANGVSTPGMVKVLRGAWSPRHAPAPRRVRSGGGDALEQSGRRSHAEGDPRVRGFIMTIGAAGMLAMTLQADTELAKRRVIVLAQADQRAGAADRHPDVGMRVTADGRIRQELPPNGRYDEARGSRQSA